VQFDQRGCGRSTPSVAVPSTSLATNNTHHSVDDIERLREYLGIDRWLVWAGSWGATLALAYAERHPGRVTEMVLVSVTMTRPSDVHWLYHEVGRYFPEEWARSSAGGSPAFPASWPMDGSISEGLPTSLGLLPPNSLMRNSISLAPVIKAGLR
jgi:proline iminopeptidase